MTRIYFVRHCEATGNLNRVFQGSINTDITHLGEKQLKKLSERFKDIKLDKIYSSPLMRAQKTALAIKGDRNIDIAILNGIVELDGGIIEGKPINESFEKYPDYKDAWFNHPEDFAPENGEAMRDAYKRIEKTIFELAEKHRNETIVCASHGGIIRCLECRFLHNDIKKLKTVPFFDNTAVGLFEIDDNNNVEIKFTNDATHLTKDLFRLESKPIGPKNTEGLK